MDKLVIKGKPVYSLKDCLNKLKKAKLQEIAVDIYGIETSSKLSKEELVEKLCKIVPESMADYFAFNECVYFAAFSKVLLDELDDITQGISLASFYAPNVSEQELKKDLDYFKKTFIDHCYFFCFDPNVLVAANEVISSYLAILSYYNKNKITAGEYTELSNLAEALTHYYGVCPVSHFRKVWNLHEKTPNYTIDELDDLLRRSTEFNFEYWYSDKKIIHHSVFDVEEAQNIITEGKNKPWYIPSIKELRTYFDQPLLAIRTPMLDWLNKKFKSKQSAESFYEILFYSIKKGFAPSELFNLFDDTDVSFSSQNEITTFMNILQDMQNNTPLWVNHGFSPKQLRNFLL